MEFRALNLVTLTVIALSLAAALAVALLRT